ncbi:MAG: hypothetical protein KIH69_002250 [Anaerolineae bacterium]|nr:hypothetical protein [Anaerolineae bacterium]
MDKRRIRAIGLAALGGLVMALSLWLLIRTDQLGARAATRATERVPIATTAWVAPSR